MSSDSKLKNAHDRRQTAFYVLENSGKCSRCKSYTVDVYEEVIYESLVCRKQK